MPFRIHALDPALFAPLFDLDDAALAARGGHRTIADAPAAYPCRVSLQDAEVGESLLLLPYEHLPAPSPYRASGPVFVRRAVPAASLAPGQVPGSLRRRLLSLRAYRADGTMAAADVVEGREIEELIARLFADPTVAMAHAHFARPGCFACRIERG